MQSDDICKPLEEMTLMDHFMFEEVMENPENTKLMLDIILEDDITLKGLPQTEKELRKQPTNRLARLDIWTKDIKNTIYDTELQNQKVPNLSKRTRYYQAMIDCKLLTPGEKDFNQLNNVYIILIAPFDLFGYGLYRYTFIGQCVEIPELKMNDGATRIFLNTKGTDNNGVSNELIEFLKFMEYTNDETIKYTSPKILKLKENIKTMLKDTEYSIKYLRFREAYYREHKEEIEADKAAARAEGLAEGLAEGRAKGHAEGRAEGRAEGHTMGVTEATHNNIIELLHTISEIPPSLTDKILAQNDNALLKEWLIKAAHAKSIEEFEKSIA